MATMNDKEWNDWTRKFLDLGKDASKYRSMVDTEHRLFLRLAASEMQGGQRLEDELIALMSTHYLFQVLQKRSQLLNLKITTQALAFVCVICNSPGDAVMWAHVLRKMQRDTLMEVSLETITSYFPYGLPTTEARAVMWEAQKGLGGAPDNYLDLVQGAR